MPGPIPPTPFGEFFPPPSFHTHADLILAHAEGERGEGGGLCAFAEFSVGGSLLFQKGNVSPCHRGLPRLPALSPQLREPPGSTWLLPAHTTAWKFFKGSELE